MSTKPIKSYDDIHFLYTTKGRSRKLLIQLIDYVTDEASLKYPGLDQLEFLHHYCDSSNVNDLRLSIFHRLNNHFGWKEVITNSIVHRLRSHLGPNIYIQKNINISVQLPQDRSSILPIHSDCMSGDSPFQLNLWIPLTPAYGSNTMFLIERETSLRLIYQQTEMFAVSSMASKEQMDQVIQECNNVPITKKHYVHAQPGDFFIFNPAVLHGNEINTTTSTRVSLNVRLATIGAPSPLANDSDRSFFNYYQPLVESRSHTFSKDVYAALESLM
jgi:sporadic carbohydrate cluster 2OG-Fe(II) oxygenase